DREGAAESLLKRSDAWIRESSGILTEPVVFHTPDLAAELDDLIAVQIGRRVADRKRRHLAAAWESCRSSEDQVGTADRDRRQRDRHARLADIDAECGRVDEGLWDERNADAVETAAQFVDERRAEDVRLVDRHDLAMAAAPVGEAGHRLSL